MKILTDGMAQETKKELQKQTYREPIKFFFQKLQIVASHFGHWGWVSEPVELEFEEVSPEYIRILGESPRFCLIVVCFFSFTNFVIFFNTQVTGTRRPRMPATPPRCPLPPSVSSLAMPKGSGIRSPGAVLNLHQALPVRSSHSSRPRWRTFVSL